MPNHVEDQHPEHPVAAQQAEDDLTIDFVPEPHQLARPRRRASAGMPRWVGVAAVTLGTAVVFAALSVRPAKPVKQATIPQAEIVRVNGQPVASGKIEVFELPPWNDNEPGAKMVVVPQD